MLQLLRRDVGAFEELYERHSRIVYSLVLRILRQGSTAEEVVQDVFLQLWRNSSRYDVSRPFVPWLLTLARNRALDQLRLKSERQRRREEQTEEFPQIASAAPEFEKALEGVAADWHGQQAPTRGSMARWLLHVFPIAIRGDWERLAAGLAAAGAAVEGIEFGVW